MSFPFKPILDRVLVQEDPVEENQIISAGIVKSQHFQKSRTYRGTVLSVGDGVPMGGVLLSIPVTPGDRVILGEYGGERFYLKPEDELSTDKRAPIYWLYRVADIQGKFIA